VLKVVLIISVALASVTLARGDAISDKARAERMARQQKFDRPYELQPRRLDSPVRYGGVPLRYENITDEEVREIELAARNVVPRALVNISGVTVGCPCEDGPKCSDQVWIVAYTPERSVGLLLSKIDGHWVIGPVQRWWLTYEELQSREREYKPYEAYLQAEEKLADTFPVCKRHETTPNNRLQRAGEE
jgi:hypothetical protein